MRMTKQAQALSYLCGYRSRLTKQALDEATAEKLRREMIARAALGALVSGGVVGVYTAATAKPSRKTKDFILNSALGVTAAAAAGGAVAAAMPAARLCGLI
jgi:hypothetical protein